VKHTIPLTSAAQIPSSTTLWGLANQIKSQ